MFVISGCSSLQNYTLKTAPAKVSVSRGDFQGALTVFPEDSAQGKDEILIRLERGMILQNLGLFEQSSAELELAVGKIRENEDKAVISAGRAANQVGTLIINEQFMPYEGYDFEIILLHALNAMNYLMRGDLEGARVEVRRSYEWQKRLSEKHEKALEEAHNEAHSSDWERSFEQADLSGVRKSEGKGWRGIQRIS